jgi:translocation and assembly module TamB
MKRALRIGAWTAATLVALVLLLVLAVFVVANTGGGRRLIESQTEQLTHGRVQLQGIGGTFPQSLDLAELSLSDDRGVWLTAQRISLRWSPLALLRFHVIVKSLEVGRIAVERAPVGHPDKNKKSTGLPRIPHIEARRVVVDAVELGAPLVGQRASLSVQGSAHLASLEDAVAAVAVRRTNGSGDYDLKLRFDPQRIDADLALEEPAGGPLAHLVKYPDLGALSVKANVGGPRNAEHVELTIRAGMLQGEIQGSVNLPGRSADLDYRLMAPAMAPRPGLAWQRVALQGRWHGPLTGPQAEGRLEIEALQVPGGVQLTSAVANLKAAGGSLGLKATVAGLVLPGRVSRLLADAPLNVNATLLLNDETRPLQLDADHRLFSLKARAVTAGVQSVRFDLRLLDVAPFAALGSLRLDGQADLSGTLQHDAAQTRLNLDARTDLTQDETFLSKLLGGSSKLTLSAALTERSLNIERLTLNGRVLTASVNGSAQRGAKPGAPALESLKARFEGSLSDLTVLRPRIAGTLKVNGQVDGPLKSMTAQMDASSMLSVAGLPQEMVEASFRARGLPSFSNAALQARGQLGGAPLHLDASVERATGGTFHLTVHRTDWKSGHVEADLTTGSDGTPGHGTVTLRMGQLADLQPFLGTQLEGSVQSGLTLRPVNRRTYADLHVDARDVVVAQIRASGQLAASGPLEGLRVQLALQSPDLKGSPAQLQSGGQLNLPGKVLDIHHFEGSYRAQSLKLLSPARLSFGDGLVVTELRLGAQSAVVELDGRLTPRLDARASLQHLDAALVNAFVPKLLAQGTLDAEADLKGAYSAPSGHAKVTAKGLRFGNAAARDVAAIDLRANAVLSGGSAQLDGELTAGTRSRLTLKGQAPLAANESFDLKLTGDVDATLANPLLEAHGERAAGVLTVNATVTGPLSGPEIAGTFDLAHGALRDYALGVHFADVTAHMVGSHGALKIERLTARAPPGEVSVTGTLGILQPRMPIDIQLTAKNAQPISSDLLTASLNADLTLKGTLQQRVEFAGTIQVDRARIGIPNGLPPEVAVLDVRRPGQAPPPPKEQRLVVGLNLTLDAPRGILVQGRGLDAELGGEIHVRGTTANPNVTGGFEMIRGKFTLGSSTLTFNTGRVSFNGAGLKGKIDPTLDFAAQSTFQDTTATLHITGFADAPNFELSSTPQLPQDEILSRLLFGKPASQLSGVEAAEVAYSLSTLSGIGASGGGLGLLSKIQKGLGLDRLSVGAATPTTTATGSTQNTGASVSAGRYVSDRVFVSVKQSTTGFSQAEVDVDLSKRLKLETKLGNGTATTQGTTPENDPGSSIGIRYQFDY